MPNENFSNPIPPINQSQNPNPTNNPKSIPENKFAAIEQLKNSINEGKPLNTIPTPNTTPETNNSSAGFDVSKIINMTLSNRKIVIGIIAAIVIAIIGGYAYYYFVYNQGTLELTFTTPPDELKISDQVYNINQTTIKFKPGVYQLSATKDQYYPYQGEFEIVAGQTTALNVSLNAFPTPDELVEYPAYFPHIDPTDQEISYLSNFGTTFYKINLNTFEKDTISSNIFNHITNIEWAPSSRQANIIKSVNDPKIHQYQTINKLYDSTLPLNTVRYHLFDFSKYDLVSQNLIAYPSTIINPTWHPTKEEIVFQYLDPKTGENTLSKSKPTLEDKQVMYDLPGFTDALAKYSPNAELISIIDTDKSTSAEPNPVYLFHTIPRNFEKIPTKDVYIDTIWSPDSAKLVAIKNDNTPTIFDVTTFEATDINLKANSNRIAWFNDSNRLVIFPINPTQNDEILIYDLATKQTTPITMTSTKKFQTIENPVINRSGNTLFFLGDEFLYSLAIQ